ncbi:disease resistance protein RPP2B-like [Actinidia eriantha]|uniref:disease resistance protein RPP2B-like n=1 Tax=Actinidia eriantha TaxID=165200 RepID=UPI0025865E00|nr:disease resistance protein RPP2B-like [Actinidia eriantha]
MVVLDLPYSNLVQFWKGTKLLKLLKILNLSRSYDLTSSPNFSKLPNLERLILKDCINLVEVHESIVELRRLVVLNLQGCKKLGKLPRKICQIKSLEKLILSGCSKLDELPPDLGKMESLKEFQLDGVNLLSSTTGEVKSWHEVVYSWVSKPSKRAEVSSASLPSFVVWLSLADCNITDDMFPKDLSSMPLLQGLRLSRNPIRNLPSSIKDLGVLMELDLERCTRLRALPELPMSLKAMTIYGCKALERATNLPNLLSSLMLSTYGCPKLDWVEGLFKLEPIEKIDSEIVNNMGLAHLESMGSLDMKLFNNLTFTSRKLQALQVLYECGIYSIFLIGSAVPAWFKNKSIGCSMSLNVPSLAKQGTWGLKVCICYGLSPNYKKSKWRHECIVVNNKTKGLKWTYRSAFIGAAAEGQDLMWLSDWKIGDQLMEGGDEVTVSVLMDDDFQVKELGVRVEHNIEQEADGIDLSAYWMGAGEYFLCNHEEYARSKYYSMMTGLGADLVEKCLCGFQYEKHTMH